MRGRTNAAAAGGGAEPVYGVLQAEQIVLSGSKVSIALPEKIKTLCGLTVVFAVDADGERISLSSYPAGSRFPRDEGSAVQENEGKIWHVEPIAGVGIPGGWDINTGGSDLTISDNTVSFQLLGSSTVLAARGGAYSYIPE